MKDVAYCLNPYCLDPENRNQPENCQNCGFPLRLANQYQAHNPIASGQFGHTFFGEDIVQSRFCLIKQFFPKSETGIFLNSRKAKQLFHSEAKRLQQLGNHSQIPQLYAHLEQDAYHYMIQEWIEGENLATALSHQGTFSEREIRKLLKSLLPVLQYLQKANIIHRDIKPENIIRRQVANKDTPELVLVDFGAAKLASHSQTGTIIGSPGYAAPEQVYGKPTFASDIYSLGVTCLHLLTGVSPFDLYSPLDNQLLWRDYLQNSPLSDSLAAILDGMTAFDLKQRYSSPQEVLSALGVLSSLPANQGLQKEVKPESNSVIKLNSGKGAIYSLDFSHNGHFLASGGGAEWGKFIGKDNCVRLWRIGNWQTHRKLNQHTAPITAVKFSQDGKFLVSGSHDKTIKLWNLQTQRLQKTLKGHRFEINTLQISPHNDVILSGSVGGEIILWNLHTGRVWDRLTLEQVSSLAISPDGEYFAVGSCETKVQVWELYSFKPLFSLTGHTDIITSLDFSPDGHYLASGSGDWDCTIKLWELATQKQVQTLRDHQLAVNSVNFSPDGKYLASGSTDKTVRMVSLFAEKPLRRCWNRHQAAVNSVVFSPNGECLASGSEDETIRVWMLQSSSLSPVR